MPIFGTETRHALLNEEDFKMYLRQVANTFKHSSKNIFCQRKSARGGVLRPFQKTNCDYVNLDNTLMAQQREERQNMESEQQEPRKEPTNKTEQLCTGGSLDSHKDKSQGMEARIGIKAEDMLTVNVFFEDNAPQQGPPLKLHRAAVSASGLTLIKVC